MADLEVEKPLDDADFDELAGGDEEDAPLLPDDVDLGDGALGGAAGEDLPEVLTNERLAPDSVTRAIVEGWSRELGSAGVDPRLEFRSSTSREVWVKWKGEWKLPTWKNNPEKFLSPKTISAKYDGDLARALGLSQADTTPLTNEDVRTLRELQQGLSKVGGDLETIELQDLGQAATDVSNELETAFTSTTLGSDDAPDLRELKGLDKALRTICGELTNNLAKLSELDGHIAMEKRKLSEAGDERDKSRITERLRDLQDERSARLEAASVNREALRTQINRMRETINRILNEDKTLAERLRTLFREQGVTIASILTAIGLAISTLVLSITGGGAAVTPSPPTPPADKGGLKEWLKKHLQSLRSALEKLAGKAVAALPVIIGYLVSWLLSTLAKTAGWLAHNLWAMVVAVGSLLIVATRELLTK